MKHEHSYYVCVLRPTDMLQCVRALLNRHFEAVDSAGESEGVVLLGSGGFTLGKAFCKASVRSTSGMCVMQSILTRN